MYYVDANATDHGKGNLVEWEEGTSRQTRCSAILFEAAAADTCATPTPITGNHTIPHSIIQIKPTLTPLNYCYAHLLYNNANRVSLLIR